MQYLLTQKEMDQFKGGLKRDEKEAMKAKLFTVCRALAEAVIRTNSSGDEYKGCVANGTLDYCIDCPAEEQCPYDCKAWPK